MSVSPLVNEFKEKCTTENKIVNGLRKHNDFLVYAYSLNKHRRWKRKKIANEFAS